MTDSGADKGVRSKSGRLIQLTEEGKAFQMDLKQKCYKRLAQKLQKDSSTVLLEGQTSVIRDAATRKQVLQQIGQWMHLYVEFVQTEEQVRSLLPEEELKLHRTNHERLLSEINKLKKDMESLQQELSRAQAQDKKQEQDTDAASVATGRSRASSSSAVRAQVQLMRLKVEQEKAETQAKLTALKTRRELELKKQELARLSQELQWQEEELELQTQASIQDAQEEVRKKMEDELDGVQPTSRPAKTEQHIQVNDDQRVTQPTGASARVPECDKTIELKRQEVTTQAQACGSPNLQLTPADQFKPYLLPALEPDQFKGNVEQFALWLKSFETYIEARTSSPVERLHYLAHYTSGEARDAIQSFLLLRTDEAYSKAKQKLMDRYGNSFITAMTYKQRLRNWPIIKPGDGKALRQLADFLEGCEAASSEVSGLKVLGDANENSLLLKKLPRYVVDRWKRVVDTRVYEPGEGRTSSYPSFSEFTAFISREARIACGPVSVQEGPQAERRFQSASQPRADKARTFMAGADTTSHGADGPRTRCKVCGADHILEHCQKFLQMSVRERHDIVYKYSLCRGCLKPGHIWRACKSRKRCNKCGKFHPTVLHDDALVTTEVGRLHAKKNESTQTSATSFRVGTTEGTACAHSMVVPVRLCQTGRPEHRIVTYALLDLQSDACFIKESVRRQIKAEGDTTCLQLSTMTGKSLEKTHAVRDLVIQPVDGGEEVTLPTTYSRSDIPADRGLIPREDTVKRWPHLKTVGQQLPPYFKDAEIGILLGINCAKAVKPLEVVSGEDHEPWAMKTVLGWSIIGILNGEPATRQKGDTSCHFTFRVQTREVSPSQLMHLFERDFNDTGEESKISQDDMKFIDIMRNGLHQREDSHMEMPLPLKNPSFSFPSNREVAMKRLQGLKRRMERDPKFREEYQTFMNEMLEKGYAEVVPISEEETDGKVWYVPHHGVYHPKKNKIRVVFDCSAEHKGVSLNSQLLQGPDVGNSLIGVLIRFRKEVVGLSCDIQGMFNQVGVSPEDRNLLRFLWWKQGDTATDPDEHRMTTHLFGATSSPACAMLALQETANRYEDTFSKKAAEFVRRDFYVDDGLSSAPDVGSAVDLAKTTIDLCAKGGFTLHKFASNEPAVLKQLPVQSRAKDLQEVDVMSVEERPVLEHALGIKWNLKDDTLGFSMDVSERPPTRRGILSLVSSLYDPLGFVSPFTLEGKKILKQLCVDGCDWDDPVPDEVALCWESWKSWLPHLSTVSVPRWYAAGLEQGCRKVYELHHFSDASLDGYGYCSYLRTITEDGQIASSLVMSKARVTPKRPLTVPRLELTAAVAAVKGSCLLRKELDIPDIREVFWTDSKVVLGYIYNESKRFHVFVSNRVQQIRQTSLPSQWRHVTSEENPADLASRGAASLEDLKRSSLWWKGPPFLLKPDLPGDVTEAEVEENDPEVKAVFSTGAKIQEEARYETLPERLRYFSSWYRAKRAVAVVRRYCNILLQRVRNRCNQQMTSPEKPVVRSSQPQLLIEVDDLKRAEEVILKAVQEDSFSEELKRLKSAQPTTSEGKRLCVKKNSTLFRLDPFVDYDGLLRVGGRLRRAEVPHEVAHPILLPNQSHVTDLIVRHLHAKVEHSGREATLSEVRHRGYWVVRGRAAVSRCILKCVKCIRLRGTPATQKMSDLPRERIEAVEPFTFTGVDYFGPFYIREKRSEVKRWAVMFTCLSSRAVHLETATSLSADSFLNAYRRFVGRRGPVRRLYCDQGTNFIGGKSLLEAALKETDHKKIKDELLKEDCDWVEFRMNVPHASHMGGVWERQIRTARAVFSSILATHGHSLDDELLRTVMVETEAIINGQPLSYTSMSDTSTVEPLTPQQLLTLKSKVVCPLPGRFCKEDLYVKHRWRRVQFLANLFWTRWRREILPTLHERRRWQATEPNLRDGDIVIVMDDTVPRGRWPVGRVVRTYPSEDGLVRKVRVQISQSEYDRPVHRLILLLKADERSRD